MSEIILKAMNVKKYFDVGKDKLHAVDDVNFEIKKGTTLGVVGESGCGKTTLGRLMIGLLPLTGGDVEYKGKNIASLSQKELVKLRSDMQIIFQDPYASINPRHRIGTIISEPLKVMGIEKNSKRRKEKVLEIMKKVGLKESMYYKYPHELDGGRRQRVGIARALALEPDFIVCDEPVSALDVSVQAQILNLLMDLQEEQDLTYMFITHDLSVVKHISDEIAVMYMGKCVEYGRTGQIFSNPLHPYTKALLSAIFIPDLSVRDQDVEIIKGEITSPINPELGCRFYSRCSYRREACKGCDIPLQEKEDHHKVACVLYQE